MIKLENLPDFIANPIYRHRYRKRLAMHERLQQAWKAFPAYEDTLSGLVDKWQIDTRQQYEQSEGALVDYNHAPCTHLADGQEAIQLYWKRRDQEAAADIGPPNQLVNIYYQNLEKLYYSKKFYQFMANALSSCAPELSAAPPGIDDFTTGAGLEYMKRAGEIIDKAMDPDGTFFDLNASRHAPDYQSIIVNPVSYPETITADMSYEKIEGALDFATRPLYSYSAYSHGDDAIYLYSHKVGFDMKGIIDKVQNSGEVFSKDFLDKLTEVNGHFSAHADANGQCTFHQLRTHEMAIGYLVHEKIHQWHSRYHAAAETAPDLVKDVTGYTKHDAFITEVSHLAYPKGNKDSDKAYRMYRHNQGEMLVDFVCGDSKTGINPRPYPAAF